MRKNVVILLTIVWLYIYYIHVQNNHFIIDVNYYVHNALFRKIRLKSALILMTSAVKILQIEGVFLLADVNLNEEMLKIRHHHHQF